MKKSITKILVVLIVIAASFGFYFYNKVASLSVDPNSGVQKQAEDIVARVGKLILLPEGEFPAVATINDPAKLQGQQFFLKAKVGDKVLIYKNTARAYLYDPVANRIIEVAPINLATGADELKTTTKTSPIPTTKKTSTK